MASKTFEERLVDMKAARAQHQAASGLYHANINVLDPQYAGRCDGTP